MMDIDKFNPIESFIEGDIEKIDKFSKSISQRKKFPTELKKIKKEVLKGKDVYSAVARGIDTSFNLFDSDYNKQLNAVVSLTKKDEIQDIIATEMIKKDKYYENLDAIRKETQNRVYQTNQVGELKNNMYMIDEKTIFLSKFVKFVPEDKEYDVLRQIMQPELFDFWGCFKSLLPLYDKSVKKYSDLDAEKLIADKNINFENFTRFINSKLLERKYIPVDVLQNLTNKVSFGIIMDSLTKKNADVKRIPEFEDFAYSEFYTQQELNSSEKKFSENLNDIVGAIKKEDLEKIKDKDVEYKNIVQGFIDKSIDANKIKNNEKLRILLDSINPTIRTELSGVYENKNIKGFEINECIDKTSDEIKLSKTENAFFTQLESTNINLNIDNKVFF